MRPSNTTRVPQSRISPHKTRSILTDLIPTEAPSRYTPENTLAHPIHRLSIIRRIRRNRIPSCICPWSRPAPDVSETSRTGWRARLFPCRVRLHVGKRRSRRRHRAPERARDRSHCTRAMQNASRLAAGSLVAQGRSLAPDHSATQSSDACRSSLFLAAELLAGSRWKGSKVWLGGKCKICADTLWRRRVVVRIDSHLRFDARAAPGDRSTFAANLACILETGYRRGRGRYMCPVHFRLARSREYNYLGLGLLPPHPLLQRRDVRLRQSTTTRVASDQLIDDHHWV